MWIKWKYNDHGHPDFEELEVPDDVKEQYGSVEDFICDQGLVPTWSERFLVGRIKWEKIKTPSKQYLEREISNLKTAVKWRRNKIKELQSILDKKK